MKTDFNKVTGIGKETKKALQENIQDLIHPWQYKDADIHIVNIDSDISDVESNWNEDIRFRQGFKINDDGSLNIPTMFVQINGIYSKKADYKAFIERMDTKNTVRYKTTKNLFDTYNSLEAKETRKLCKNNEVHAFENLNSSMQKMMNKKLMEFIDKYDGEVNCFERVLGNICYMNDANIISLLQNFDYCFSNPKIIVENMDDKNFTEVTKYILLFLYSLGFDIMIFSPKGSSFLKGVEINQITLERYLSPSEDEYDYRDDDEIKKAKKEEEKKRKKIERENTRWERARKRHNFFFGLIMFAIIAFFVGGMVWAIYSEEANKSNYEKITEEMNWDLFPKTMYVNSDDTVAYIYASEEAEQNTTYDKDDEVNVIRTSSDWVEVKKGSGTIVYIKSENVREEMYDIDVSNFHMNIKVGADVNAYEFPDVTSEVIHTYKTEDTMTATAYNSDWYQIEYGFDTGFVSREELTVYEEPEEEDTQKVETETQEETEENLDGEVVEGNNEVVILLIAAIVIFIILFLMFCAIMF